MITLNQHKAKQEKQLMFKVLDCQYNRDHHPNIVGYILELKEIPIDCIVMYNSGYKKLVEYSTSM
jgi:hypothetical protein